MPRLQYLRVCISYKDEPVLENSASFLSEVLTTIRRHLAKRQPVQENEYGLWKKSDQKDVKSWVEGYNKN